MHTSSLSIQGSMEDIWELFVQMGWNGNKQTAQTNYTNKWSFSWTPTSFEANTTKSVS